MSVRTVIRQRINGLVNAIQSMIKSFMLIASTYRQQEYQRYET